MTLKSNFIHAGFLPLRRASLRNEKVRQRSLVGTETVAPSYLWLTSSSSWSLVSGVKNLQWNGPLRLTQRGHISRQQQKIHPQNTVHTIYKQQCAAHMDASTVQKHNRPRTEAVTETGGF